MVDEEGEDIIWGSGVSNIVSVVVVIAQDGDGGELGLDIGRRLCDCIDNLGNLSNSVDCLNPN